jgi:hypothetical protein
VAGGAEVISLLLATTLYAATFTSTITGEVTVHVPCAKHIKGARMYVYWRNDETMFKVGEEEIVLQWLPPSGVVCIPTELLSRYEGEKHGYRTWSHVGMAPCLGVWDFKLVLRRRDTLEEIKTMLTSEVQGDVK